MIEKYELTPSKLGMIVFIFANGKHKNNEYIGKVLKESLFESGNYKEFEELGLIEYVKAGRKDLWWRVRLTKKGKDIFNSVFGDDKINNPKATEFANILQEYYNEYEVSKKFKNFNKTELHISKWLNYKETEQGLEYNENKFRALIMTYMQDFNYEDRKFIKESQNLFYTPDTRYSVNWTPNQCPIEGFLNTKHIKVKIKENYLKLIN